MKLLNFISNKSTNINIGIGILFILLINIVIFPYFSSEDVNIKSILDLHFGFSYDDVLSSLSSMKESGRKRYLLTTFLIDTPYALFYGLIYTFIIVKLSKNTFIKSFPYLVLIPLFISIFDLLENTGIIYFCVKFPDINNRIVTVFSFANQLKWVFGFLTLTVISILTLSKLRTKSASNNVHGK
jgi:hypothetical protein